MKSWSASRQLHADVVAGCDGYRPLGRRSGSGCTWAVPGSRGRIVLLGDSNAGQLTEPVVEAGNRLGYTVTGATFSSCPYVGSASRPSCERFVQGTLDALLRHRPSLVVMASRTDRYLAIVETAQDWQTRLDGELRRLNDAGIPVLVVNPIPALARSPDRCAVLRILTGSCGSAVSRLDD